MRSCWDYHLRSGEFLTWIAILERDGITVLNPPELIRWNHDKIYLSELAAKGVPIPETIFLAPGDNLDLASVCASRGWTKAVVKPQISASAWKTECRTSGVICGPMLIQEYVTAIEIEGEWSLVYVHGRFSHAVVKRPRSGDFRVQSEFGGQVQETHPPARLVKFADAAVEKLEFPSLFARVDLISDHENIWLMELELIEPELFLDLLPGAAARVADCIVSELSRQTYTPFKKRQVRTEGMLEARAQAHPFCRKEDEIPTKRAK